VTQSGHTLADEIIRLIEINRTTINALGHGKIIFGIHQGHLVEVTTSDTLNLTAGVTLRHVRMKAKEVE
jgi:hypothetical protein